MVNDPFLIPADGRFYTIHFSGGRTSAYMLKRVLDAHGGQLPENARAIFANTGKEREETLEFVKECSERWNCPIVWLEYRHDPQAKGGAAAPKNLHAVVDFKTAARHGEPFESLVMARSYLPNPTQRICTYELKVETIRRYLQRELGIEQNQVCKYLGIRRDEPRRINQALMEQCQADYPLYHAGVELQDVTEYWRQSEFDLGIESYWGNCDLCFLKGRTKVLHLISEDPSAAEWWMRMEQAVHSKEAYKNRTAVPFNKDWSYAELVDEARRNPEIPFDKAQPLQESESSAEDSAADCFCGD